MSALEEYEAHARNMRFGAGHFSTVSRERADAMRDELLAENARLRVCGNCNHCEMDCGCEFGADTAMCESCVYSPSRWKERKP